AQDKAADPIIVHPDVRRMLLTMKALTEGGRAFACYVGQQLDLAKFSEDDEERKAAASLLSDPRQPALVRASSARRLGQPDSPQALDALRQGLADPDAQVRRASLGALESLPAARRVQWIAPLLSDPVRSVRAEAARLLADAPVPEELQASFASALEEYEAQLRFNADRADARTELASLRRRQGLQLA